MPARAFAEQRVLRVQFHAELEVLGRLAVLADAQVAGRDAFDRAIVVVQHFGGRKAREDFDAERFGLLTQPARDVREADHVVAVVLEVIRQRPDRHALRAGFGQEQELVFGHVHRERRAFFLPVRDQFGDRARVHHRARQDMRPDLRAFFQYAHADLDAFLRRQLLQADRRGQAGRAAADDHDVVFHRLARAVLLNETYVCHDAMPFLELVFTQRQHSFVVLRADDGCLKRNGVAAGHDRQRTERWRSSSRRTICPRHASQRLPAGHVQIASPPARCQPASGRTRRQQTPHSDRFWRLRA